jgi:diguanylate cyclase (GGDEF)-like protein
MIKHLNTTPSITCSFGISAYKEGDTMESLIKQADLALYKAKDSGRNNSKKFCRATKEC